MKPYMGVIQDSETDGFQGIIRGTPTENEGVGWAGGVEQGINEGSEGRLGGGVIKGQWRDGLGFRRDVHMHMHARRSICACMQVSPHAQAC
jgi:hypothetical protein